MGRVGWGGVEGGGGWGRVGRGEKECNGVGWGGMGWDEVGGGEEGR